MAVRAYVLIQAEVGRAEEVTELVRATPGVESADQVAGPYDIIALASTPTIEELGRVVVSKVQLIEGITRTLTCPVVSDR